MQQLNPSLLAPGPTAIGSRPVAAGIADAHGAQKFDSHLSKLTEQLNDRHLHGSSENKPGQRSASSAESASADSQAVTELAKAMLQSAGEDGLPADEAWLSMVEELNSMAAGDISLQELSSRHGVDVAALEAQLDHALAEFDGDMRALIDELQQVLSGNALPPATAQNNQITIAERAELKDSLAKLVAGDSIKALLTKVEELSAEQQAEFAAGVNELIAQLSELQEFSDQAGNQRTASFNAELSELSETLQNQIRALLETDSQLTQRQHAQLQGQLTMLDKVSELSLDNIVSEAKTTQQLAEELEQLDLPEVSDEIADLLAALQAVLNDSVASTKDAESLAGEHSEIQSWLQTVDLNALQDKLNDLLEVMEREVGGVNRDELLALLQTQLRALESLNASGEAVQTDEQDSEALARVSQLLSELNQKLEIARADIRVIDTNRTSESGNTLPPVAQALNQASQQLRAQIQAALQLQQEQSGDQDDADTGDFENLRRLLSESSASAGESRSTLTNAAVSGLQSVSQGNQGQTATAQASGMQRTTEQPAQSAFETARQAQQAIDILGTGAADRLRERVSVMFNTRTQAAEMRLNPPDLGRLNIRLNLNQEQATVSFQVTTPQAREALEQSLPRLREMLAEQGIELADANVSEQKQDNSQESSAEQGQYSAQGDAVTGNGELAADGELEIASPVVSADGRVDYFV